MSSLDGRTHDTLSGVGQFSFENGDFDMRPALGGSIVAGRGGAEFGEDYAGPLDYLDWEFVGSSARGLSIAAALPKVFLHGGSGNDAITALSGSNVLDGGGGSNWMVGARVARMAGATPSSSMPGSLPAARPPGTRFRISMSATC